MEFSPHGIFVPLATPFKDNGETDLREVRRLVEAIGPHVDGFVPNGTTADFPLLTPKERDEILETVRAAAGDKKLIIAGVGAISTEETINLAGRARDAGADAALVVKPYYVRPTAAGLRDHFMTVAKAAPTFPHMLYNFPKLMGQEIPVEVVQALTESVGNVLGMKDSSGQLPYTLSIIEATPPFFHVLVGHGALLLPAMAMGAAGAILAAANLVPRAYRAMYTAALANEWDQAQELQSRIYPVAALVARYGSIAVRVGLELLGFKMGAPRSPLSIEGTLTPEEREKLRRSLLDLRDV